MKSGPLPGPPVISIHRTSSGTHNLRLPILANQDFIEGGKHS